MRLLSKKILRYKNTPFSLSKMLLLIILIFFTAFYDQDFLLPDETDPKDDNIQGASDNSSVKINQVIDGDTVRLSDGRTLRYIGIDTPEDPKATNKECYALESYLKNTELVLGKEVQLEKDVSEVDRYGRLLRYVWLNGVLVNELLVKEGYAEAVTYRPDVKYQNRLNLAEKEAMRLGRGLWNYCD